MHEAVQRLAKQHNVESSHDANNTSSKRLIPCGPSRTSIALDGACAAACASEWLGPDLQDGVDQPVPDEDDDLEDPDGDVQMKDNSEPETEPDKNEEKP